MPPEPNRLRAYFTYQAVLIMGSTSWIEERQDCPRGPGKTAVCPRCGIDSALPDNIDLEITKEFLTEIQKEFFE